MKTKIPKLFRLLSITFFLVLNLNAYSQVDSFPYRGLYVNYFGPWPGFFWEDNSGVQHWAERHFTHILGNDTLEDQLLEYARDNNFKRLDLYELRYMLNPDTNNTINPNSNNLWSVDLCNFIIKAKTNYCIEEISAIGGSRDDFQFIENYDTSQISPIYNFTTPEQIQLRANNPFLSIVEQSYSTSDTDMIILSEIIKFYLRINDFNITHQNIGGIDCRFDILTSEVEWWWSDSAGYHQSWKIFASATRFLRALQSTTSSHFRIHNYIGYIQPISFADSNIVTNLTEQQVSEFVDSVSDKIYLVDYKNDITKLWSTAGNCQTCFTHSLTLLGNNSKPNSVISPLFSCESNSGGSWINPTENHTISGYEKFGFFDSIQFKTAMIGDNILTPGSTQWFTYTWAKQIPSPWIDSLGIIRNLWEDTPGIYTPLGFNYCVNNVPFTIQEPGASEICDANNIFVTNTNTNIAFELCSNYENGVTYNIDFGDGTSANNLSPVDSSLSIPFPYTVINHSYSQPDTFIVNCTINFPPSLQNQSSCSYQGFQRTIIVNGTAPSLNCTTYTDSISQTDFDSMIPPISGQFNLNSNVILTKNVVLSNCSLAIREGISITVPSPFTLYIDQQSLLFACNAMWRGIIVTSGGQVRILDGSTIQDAQYGIEARGGTNLFVENANFVNNYVGVYLSSFGTSNPVSINTQVKNSHFYSNSLTSGYTGQLPAPQTHSFAGIYADSVTFINIGSGSNFSNIFEDMNFGIYALHSNINVENSVFRRIQEFDIDPLANRHFAGVGIFLFGNGQRSLTQIGANNTSINDFEDCLTAIYVKGASLKSYHNNIFNCDIGYRIDQNNLGWVNVTLNNLDCNHFGFELLFNDNVSDLRISDNVIHVGSRLRINNPIPPQAFGIDIHEQSITNFRRYINNNTITLHDFAENGIFANATSGYNINHNYVFMNNLNTNLNGICLNRSDKFHVTCNNVAGNGTTFTNPAQSAMFFQDSPENTINCNTVTQSNNGYTFMGTCLGGRGTIFRANDIGNHNVGLLYRGAATRVDQQDLKGNYWYRDVYTGGIAARDENIIWAGNDQYTVDGNGPRFQNGQTLSNHPRPGEVDPSNFIQDRFQSLDENCGAAHHIDCIVLDEPTGGGSSDRRAALNLEGSQDYDEETKWKLRTSLYERLMEDPAYLTSDPVFGTFYASMAGSMLRKVATVNTGRDNLYKNQQALADIIQQRSLDIFNVSLSLLVCDSLLNAGGDPVYLDSIKTARMIIQTTIENLISLNEAAIANLNTSISSGADILQAENAQINSQEVYEQNEKSVNEFYLNVIVKKQFHLIPSYSSQIISIAQQCPLSGGPAVYRARSLARLIDSSLRYEDELNCSLNGYTWKLTKPKTNSTFSLFPNPSFTFVNVSYQLKSMGLLIVNDEIGKPVMEVTLDSNQKTIEIDISQLQNGIYFCSLINSDDTAREVVKMVVIH